MDARRLRQGRHGQQGPAGLEQTARRGAIMGRRDCRAVAGRAGLVERAANQCHWPEGWRLRRASPRNQTPQTLTGSSPLVAIEGPATNVAASSAAAPATSAIVARLAGRSSRRHCPRRSRDGCAAARPCRRSAARATPGARYRGSSRVNISAGPCSIGIPSLIASSPSPTARHAASLLRFLRLFRLLQRG